MKFLFILVSVFITATGWAMDKDPRVNTGATGVTNVSGCNCTIDEKYISDRVLAFQKLQDLKLLPAVRGFKSKSQ